MTDHRFSLSFCVCLSLTSPSPFYGCFQFLIPEGGKKIPAIHKAAENKQLLPEKEGGAVRVCMNGTGGGGGGLGCSGWAGE